MCSFIFLFSNNQKIIVKPTIDKKGISSAQNLQTAPFDKLGIGDKLANSAHPTKNISVFPVIISNFFIYLFLYISFIKFERETLQQT